jgi:hypothetical protein
MNGRFQCKDIPDKPILGLLRDPPNWYCPGFENNATPMFLKIPDISLVHMGLINGYSYNCCGDSELLSKGHEIVRTKENLR